MAETSPFQLTHEQQVILQTLASSPLRERLYWTGGTALAYFYLHHRQSYDVDLFSDTPLTLDELAPFVRKIADALSTPTVEQKRIHDRYEFIFSGEREMRLDCVWYNFPSLRERKTWEGIRADSFEDLVANKLMALVERREGKDVFDIYTLLKKNLITIPNIIDLAQKKFGLRVTEETVWADGLLACNKLKNIQPLLLGSGDDQERQAEEVCIFFKDHAAKRMRDILKE
ncbi:MAG: nucleotidyl transferase AbiEii/AbiGii toxin family protein [Patescibacteria group bacterium]